MLNVRQFCPKKALQLNLTLSVALFCVIIRGRLRRLFFNSGLRCELDRLRPLAPPELVPGLNLRLVGRPVGQMLDVVVGSVQETAVLLAQPVRVEHAAADDGGGARPRKDHVVPGEGRREDASVRVGRCLRRGGRILKGKFDL